MAAGDAGVFLITLWYLRIQSELVGGALQVKLFLFSIVGQKYFN